MFFVLSLVAVPFGARRPVSFKMKASKTMLLGEATAIKGFDISHAISSCIVNSAKFLAQVTISISSISMERSTSNASREVRHRAAAAAAFVFIGKRAGASRAMLVRFVTRKLKQIVLTVIRKIMTLIKKSMTLIETGMILNKKSVTDDQDE